MRAHLGVVGGIDHIVVLFPLLAYVRISGFLHRRGYGFLFVRSPHLHIILNLHIIGIFMISSGGLSPIGLFSVFLACF